MCVPTNLSDIVGYHSYFFFFFSLIRLFTSYFFFSLFSWNFSLSVFDFFIFPRFITTLSVRIAAGNCSVTTQEAKTRQWIAWFRRWNWRVTIREKGFLCDTEDSISLRYAVSIAASIFKGNREMVQILSRFDGSVLLTLRDKTNKKKKKKKKKWTARLLEFLRDSI